MKKQIGIDAYTGLVEISRQEQLDINGGGFWEDIAYVTGYVAHVYVALIADNIQHPIGAAGGYPPR